MSQSGASGGTRGRSTLTVPTNVGDSTNITIGGVGTGQRQPSIRSVTVVLEQIPAGAKVELWLPSVADSNTGAASAFTDANYVYSGQVCVPARVAYTATGETASYGSSYWLLAGYAGAQLRVVNGTGLGGAATISWSAI